MPITSTYGQFCPVAKAAEIVADRWTPLVLRELLLGSYRFNDLHRGVPLMSPALLSRRLKELERVGVVARRRPPTGTGWEYHLTPAGEELWPVIESLGLWGYRWATREFTRKDLDPSLLMWDIRRRAARDHLPEGHAVVLFEFTDVPGKKRQWWLVFNRGEVDLCLVDPGFDIDLTVSSEIETMAHVWLGKHDLGRALESGEITLLGSRDMVRSFRDWFALSLFARAASLPQRKLA